MRDGNVVVRELRKMQKEYKRNVILGAVGFVVAFFGTALVLGGCMSGGILICAIPVTALGVQFFVMSTLSTTSIERRTRYYAAQKLFLPKYQELFQIYEFNPDKEMPRYLLEQAGVADKKQKCYGYAFLRAAYRGAMFMAGEVLVGMRGGHGEDDSRPSERHAGLTYDKCIYSSGFFARVDLNCHVNGYLKIEGHGKGGLVRGIMNVFREFEAKNLGYKIYDFSGVNPEFQRRYTITTTDENFAQQLLTASMMQRLVDVANSSNGYIELTFMDDNLFYMNNTKKYYFGIHGEKYTEQHLLEDEKLVENEIYAFRNTMDIFIEKAPFMFFH